MEPFIVLDDLESVISCYLKDVPSYSIWSIDHAKCQRTEWAGFSSYQLIRWFNADEWDDFCDSERVRRLLGIT